MAELLNCAPRSRSLREVRLFGLAGMVAMVTAGALQAQSAAGAMPAAAASQKTTVTAADSLELPVLIVDHEHRPADGITLEQLRIKTGAGQPFAPLAMRLEDEDPVSLAILIDASRDSFHDLDKLGDEFASMIGSVLLPRDRITMYAADCAMTRSMLNAPPEAAALRKGVVDALAAPTLHGGKTHSVCGKTVTLWDDVAVAIAGLSHAPGRRVLLMISGGTDGASKYDWLTVQQYAFDQGVAIFAMRDERQADADDYKINSLTTTHGTPGIGARTFTPTPPPRKANSLELLCANSGGLTLMSQPEFRKDGLAVILFLVRKRYILTIPKGGVSAWDVAQREGDGAGAEDTVLYERGGGDGAAGCEVNPRLSEYRCLAVNPGLRIETWGTRIVSARTNAVILPIRVAQGQNDGLQ